MSLVSVVCCQVKVSASGWPFVHGSPTEWGLSECDRESSTMRRSCTTGECCSSRGVLPSGVCLSVIVNPRR